MGRLGKPRKNARPMSNTTIGRADRNPRSRESPTLRSRVPFPHQSWLRALSQVQGKHLTLSTGGLLKENAPGSSRVFSVETFIFLRDPFHPEKEGACEGGEMR